jgi:hypothetical protein
MVPQTFVPTVTHSRAARSAIVITPDDNNDLVNHAFRGLYIGGAGNIKVDMEGSGTAVLFSAVPAGTILPIQVRRVYSTGTTATLIVALY